MILDRISLNLALKYLDQIQQNEGPVFNILFSLREHHTDVTKTVKFESIEVLLSFIERWANPSGFQNLDCKSLNLFELKSFSFDKNNTDKNLVYNSGEEFVTKTANVNEISVLNLNRGYLVDMIEIKELFDSFKLDEYILLQYTYIDCGYISIYFESSVEKLKQLYYKYK
jgi:hypothetical protein